VPAESRYLSEWIARPAADVYEYASNPANVPAWAPGLGTSVEKVGDRWFVDTPSGRASLSFAERNDFGVLDHEVALPSGEVVYVPMRVIPDGDGSEVAFCLRRLAGVTDEEFERDAGLVQADLARLKRVLESGA
jgi:Polyketide cyclase / dehydrase and lipid transport